MTEKMDSLEFARGQAALMSASLPKEIDLLSFAPKYKTAAKVHILRECLIWRMEELTRNALFHIDSGDDVASALLARAVIETTAMMMFVHDIVKRGIEKGLEEGDDEKLTGLLTGSKMWDGLPGAVNVITMIKKVEKLVPGVWHTYEALSEVAHPNWQGMQGAYAITDEKNLTVSFKRGGRNPEMIRKTVIPSLAGSLGLFEHYYSDLGELLASYGAACEAFYESRSKARADDPTSEAKS